MKRINILSWLLNFALLIGFTACQEQELTGPIIDLTGIENGTVKPTGFAASSDNGIGSTAVFLEENAAEVFQTFSWATPNAGATIAYSYTLQADTSEAGGFAEPITLGATSGLEMSFTVGQMNTALFSAVQIEGEPITFHVRVKATATDPDGNLSALPPMYSDVITMSAALYSTVVVTVSPIGIIGSATAGGWDVDTDMANPSGDEENYEITIALKVGETKFRKNDAWDINWGAADFPEGTGEAGGPNIPIAEAGLYYVTFNSTTGDYSFTKITIGIVGDATPNGWDGPDVEMTLLADGVTWTASATLIDGNAKFRQNNAWTVNWGGTDFPAGTATEGGGDIPVTAGTYQVYFNTSTLAYSFESPKSIGIIGSATPEGWDADTDMANPSGDGTNWVLENIELVEGQAKFRLNDAWDTNWGGADFPMGTGVQDGTEIPVKAGFYNVYFNSETGSYNFESNYSIGIIGSATTENAGDGWKNDIDMQNPSGDLENWEAVIYLYGADDETRAVKFRLNDDWATSWGGDTDPAAFPKGTATSDNGKDIFVTESGWYKVTFNTATLEYEFVNAVFIGIIGSATTENAGDGWAADIDMENPSGDEKTWETTLYLYGADDGSRAVKFRQNDNWDVSWGGDTDPAAFPTGTATSDNGKDIFIPKSGRYKVTFNTETLTYTFEYLARIGIIGSATAGGWDADTDMQNPSGDDESWEITIDLVSGAVKFRENDKWDVSWGGDTDPAAFPTGTATSDNGKDIPINEAGTYKVTFNTTSLAYSFEKQ